MAINAFCHKELISSLSCLDAGLAPKTGISSGVCQPYKKTKKGPDKHPSQHKKPANIHYNSA